MGESIGDEEVTSDFNTEENDDIKGDLEPDDVDGEDEETESRENVESVSENDISIMEVDSQLNALADRVMDSGKAGDSIEWKIIENIDGGYTLSFDGVGEMYDYDNMNYSGPFDNPIPWYTYHKNITTIYFSDGITSIGDNTFLNCENLMKLTVPESIISIGYTDQAGNRCTFHGSGSKIKTAGPIGGGYDYEFGWTDSIPTGAFDGCALMKIHIPSSVTKIGTGGVFQSGIQDTFRGSQFITAGPIGGGYDYEFECEDGIPYGAFNNCTTLKEVTFPRECKYIESYAFFRCTSLEKIIMPSNLEQIGKNAFCNTDNLKYIVFKGDAFKFPDSSIDEYTIFNGNNETIIYYPVYKIGWEKIIGGNYGGNLTWIPYNEGETPWLEEESGSDIPQILITPTYNNSNLTFSEMDGYIPKSFDISFGVSAMNDTLSGLDYQSLNNVKVTVTLPKGMSFSQDTDIPNKEYAVGTLDGTIIGVQNQYTDTIYITTAEYKSSFSVLFSATADGFEKPKETTLEIPITKNGDIDYNFYNIQVYSEFPNCIIGTNQTCAIMPVMADGDNVIKGEEGWNFSIENTDIAGIQEYPQTDYGTAVRIVGKATGSTKLHIIHIPTGKSVDVSILVAVNTMVYNLSDVTGYTDNTGIMNSGIFTNNYKSVRVNGGYKVTFDAYNQCASAGAVEVYNSEDQLVDACEIKKFDAYQTGIKEVAMDGWNLVTSGFNGTISSITNSMYTAHTPISIEKVPDGGYIVITNDITASLPAALYNLVDLTSWIYEEKEILKGWSGKEGFKDKAKINVSQEMINAFLGVGYDKSAINQFTEKLTKSVSKDLSINSKDVANMVVNLLSDADIVLQEKNVDLGAEIRDAAIDTGIDVAMDIFNEFSPTGDVIQGMFDVNTTLNGFMQIVYVNRTEGARSVRIDVNGSSDKLVSGDFVVENTDGSSFINTDLVVVDVTEDDTSKYIIQMLSGAKQVKIYNIAMYQDSIEIQPEKKIKVKVPLPATYNKDKCLIYRVEADNSLTDMKASFADGYLVFETDHLSLYALVEMEDAGGDIPDPSILVESIKIKNAPETLNVNKTQQLIVEILPATASNKVVTWTSSNETVAVVSADGTVTGVSEGDVIITAKANDGSNISDIVEITVKAESGGNTEGGDNPSGGNDNSDDDNTGGDESNTGGGNSGGNSGENTDNTGNNGDNAGSNNESSNGNTINTVDSNDEKIANSLINGGEKKANESNQTNISGNRTGLEQSGGTGTDVNKTSGSSTTEREPKTGDDSPVEIYATIAMIAGFIYILTYFVGTKRGMTEEDKNQLLAEIIKWAKQGAQFRRYMAYGAVFFLLLYYHSIGKHISVKWEEVYGK